MGPGPSWCGEARVGLQRPGILPLHRPPLRTPSRKPHPPCSAVSLGHYLPDFLPVAFPTWGTVSQAPRTPQLPSRAST